MNTDYRNSGKEGLLRAFRDPTIVDPAIYDPWRECLVQQVAHNLLSTVDEDESTVDAVAEYFGVEYYPVQRVYARSIGCATYDDALDLAERVLA